MMRKRSLLQLIVRTRCGVCTRLRVISAVTTVLLILGVGSIRCRAQTAGDTGPGDFPTERGPIPIRDSRPLNLLFLQFTPESGDVLKRNTNRYDLQLDVINNMQIPSPGSGSTVVEDNEYQRLRFAWRHGLPGKTEFALFVPLQWRNAGMLDGVISAYHHMMGLADNSLDVPLGMGAYPLYQSKLQIIDSSGNVLLNRGNAFGFGESVMTLKREITPLSRRSAVAVRLGVKLPTGNVTEVMGSGHFDAGASLDARYSLGRNISVYGNLGYVLLGTTNIAYGSRPNTVQSLACLEYHPNSRDSFVLQVDGNGQFVTTGNAFADRSNVTATFGYRRKFDRCHVGYLSFSEGGHIENYTMPSIGNASPNFTVSMGLTWLQK